MRHTVIGLFDSYAQAESARNMLVQAGFASADIELQANPETPADVATAHTPGVIANIERFLSSLFQTSGTTAPEAERYTEAVRRGAVLVAVNAASESHAELARNSLTRLGAIEVSERPAEGSRAAATRDDAAQARREHSVMDELGISTPAAVPTAAQPSSDARLTGEEARKRAQMDTLHGVPPVDEPSAQALAAASAPGAGAVMRPETPPPEQPGSAPSRTAAQQETTRPGQYPNYAAPTSTPPVTPPGETPGAAAVASAGIAGSGAVMTPDTAEPARAMPQQVPDEFLEYEEDFRAHYDAQYADEGSRFDEYVPAYHHGAAMARETRYQDRQWDEVEPEVREHWERDRPEGSWERFKAAVRHGWDRVTGHRHT
ncbi:conserved hypothetical protein [Paraburkholderia piptadeniae]|uniref:Uncharacterized protein n=1 Tax=Paraburkholderia piptadeniae TaxID=1701573 RepID=A0A1N7SD54_9BURK|nr:hypothetical protein [Paraburkholderia piptadeniae]SIT45293.1 conserved hypothetical protein [Paraburkholderia piptadeniae]